MKNNEILKLSKIIKDQELIIKNKDLRIENYIHKLTKRIIKLELSNSPNAVSDNKDLIIEKLRYENVKLFIKIGELKNKINNNNIDTMEDTKDITREYGSRETRDTEEDIREITRDTKEDIRDIPRDTKDETNDTKDVIKEDIAYITTENDMKDSKDTMENAMKDSKVTMENAMKDSKVTIEHAIEDTKYSNSKRTEPNNNDLQFKFQEVVRNKKIRSTMHGVSCECCSDYYKITKNLNRPNSKQDPKQQISRHRVWSKRPSTPPGYWQVDFPSTQEIEQYKK